MACAASVAAAKLELLPLLNGAPPVSPAAAAPDGVLATVKGDAAALFALLTGSRLNALLVCVPLGCLSQYLGWSPMLRFGLVRAADLLVVRAIVRVRTGVVA